MKVSRSGQITIPPGVQEQLGMLPGTEYSLR